MLAGHRLARFGNVTPGTFWSRAHLVPGTSPALCALAFALGSWLLQQQARLPTILWGYVLLAASLGAVGALRAQSARVRRGARFAVLLLSCAAGFLWAAWAAHVRLADALAPEWEGRDVAVVGVVADLPEHGARGVTFGFDIEATKTPAALVPRRVSLIWYDDAAYPRPTLEPGQRWGLIVRLRRPHGSANPHGFDYEAWLLERGIRATGYVRRDGGNRLVVQSVNGLHYWIQSLRGHARDRILNALPGDRAAGVLAALAVGDQRSISPEQWTVFTRTGVNHLMSISGLHITMVGGLAFSVVLWLWRRSQRLIAYAPAQTAAALGGWLCALAYALVSGFGVPAQRTVFMLMVFAAALALRRKVGAAHVLAAALFLVTVLDPWASLSAGFWLSFGAVALILYVTLGRLGQPNWWLSWTRVQTALTLGLMPLLLVIFQQASLVAPLANAFAVPVVSLGVVPLTLVGLIAPIDLVLQTAAWLMNACERALTALSLMPETMWEQHAPATWTLPIALLGVAWILAPRGFPSRWVGAVLLLPMLLVRPAGPQQQGELWVDVLDVGQGLSAVLRTQKHALVYDVGPSFSGASDSGSRIVVPHLRAIGVGALDAVVVSHDDSDHRGGLASLLMAMPAKRVVSSLPQDDPALTLAAQGLRCYAGQRWEWDGVRFTVLHPAFASYSDARRSDNARSCVLHVAAPAGSLLLAGDIDRASELELVERAGGQLAADVLVVPHHGSATSSSPEFLSQVRPRIALIPVGARNRFGHPAPTVLERLAQPGRTVLRTDRDGALSLRFGPTLSIWSGRERRQRYWQGR